MINIINTMLWCFLSTIVFVVLISTGKLSTKYILILPFLFLFAIFLHYKSGKKDKNYLLKVIGIHNNPRIPQYDYLRVLAMSMVIITHAIQIDFSKDLIHGDTMPHILRFLAVFCMCCNTLYVMLSGALLLPYKEEKSLFHFYIKRFTSVGIPMIVYLLFYEWNSLGLANGNWNEIKEISAVLYYANFIDSPHFWLICTLLTFYVAVPFMRYMFKDLPYRWLTILVIISIIWITIPLFVKPGFGYSTFLSGWVGVAIMGYWVTRKETERYYNIIFIMGIIAIAAMIYIIQTEENYMNLCCNLSPISIIITLAIFCFVFRFKKLFQKSNPLLSILSKYSYSIILLHWWSIHFVTIARYNITVNWKHGLGLLLSLGITIIVSFIVAFVTDNLFVIVAKELWINVCTFLYRVYTKLKVNAK